MNIRERLNELDRKCLDEDTKFYDLRNLYEATRLTAQDKTELKNLLNSTTDPNMVSAFLQTKEAEKQANEAVEEDACKCTKRFAVEYKDILSPVKEIKEFDTREEAEAFFNQLVGEGIDAELKEVEIKDNIPEKLDIASTYGVKDELNDFSDAVKTVTTLGVENEACEDCIEEAKEDCCKESCDKVDESFEDTTAQGWPILKKFKDLDDGRTHVIVDRGTSFGPIAIGLGYNENTGSWSQGMYDYDTVDDAVKSLTSDNNRYGAYHVEEIVDTDDSPETKINWKDESLEEAYATVDGKEGYWVVRKYNKDSNSYIELERTTHEPDADEAVSEHPDYEKVFIEAGSPEDDENESISENYPSIANDEDAKLVYEDDEVIIFTYKGHKLSVHKDKGDQDYDIDRKIVQEIESISESCGDKEVVAEALQESENSCYIEYGNDPRDVMKTKMMSLETANKLINDYKDNYNFADVICADTNEALHISQPDGKIWKTVKGAIKATKNDDVDFQADNVMDNLHRIADKKNESFGWPTDPDDEVKDDEKFCWRCGRIESDDVVLDSEGLCDVCHDDLYMESFEKRYKEIINEGVDCSKQSFLDWDANDGRLERIADYKRYAGLAEDFVITEENIDTQALKKVSCLSQREPERIKAELLGQKWTEYEKD